MRWRTGGPITSCDYAWRSAVIPSDDSTSPLQRRRRVQRREDELHLIIVDDDADIRRGLAVLLRSHGHGVTTFESAEDYLAHAVGAHCAIVDVKLPGMSGPELYERVHASGSRLPIVFITAHVEPSVLDAARRTRWPLLRKPLVEDDLLDAIERAMRAQE
jgi:FixJ family two-component response regulator